MHRISVVFIQLLVYEEINFDSYAKGQPIAKI
jgi:hypothetical protein